MNRGDHREDIFRTEEDRELFLETIEQACAKTEVRMETRRGEENEKEFKPIQRGWMVGGKDFCHIERC